MRGPPSERVVLGQRRAIIHDVDATRDDDLRTARETPPSVKLRQAVEMMRAGLRLQRAKLRQQLPNASAAELERAYEVWLLERD